MNYTKKIFSWTILFILTKTFSVNAQRIAVLEVKIPDNQTGLEIPVQTDLDAVTHLPDSSLQLVEVKDKARIPVEYQVEINDRRNLHWIIMPQVNNQKTRVFELIKGKPSTSVIADKSNYR